MITSEMKQAARRRLLARLEHSGEDDSFLGIMGILEDTGVGIAGVGERIIASAEKAAEKMERVEAAAKTLDAIPDDVAQHIIARLTKHMPDVSKAVAAGLGSQAIADAAGAVKAAVAHFAEMIKVLDQVAPSVEAKTLALTEAAKGLGKEAAALTASESKQHEIVQSLAQNAAHYDGLTRRREWAIVVLLAALLLIPATWCLRGLFIPTPSSPDLVALIATHGGKFAVTQNADGALQVAIAGGQQQTAQGWTVFRFPLPSPNK